MPRRKTRKKQESEAQAPEPLPVSLWLKAVYIAHTFHYRMPETVAVSAVNPFVPSPLTVKMALVAAFLREGDLEKASRIVQILPRLVVHILPPDGAIAFRAFMRYARPPAPKKKPSGRFTETGAIYGISPHMREYALWSSPLSLYLGLRGTSSPDVMALLKESLDKICYLGCKDSLVTCTGVSEVESPSPDSLTLLEDQAMQFQEGFVIRLAELKGAPKMETLIPAQRKPEDYSTHLYLVPRKLRAEGKVKIMHR
ncbi:MAG: hypothetical protein V2G42_07820 [bacterium JZ-2024 1]